MVYDFIDAQGFFLNSFITIPIFHQKIPKIGYIPNKNGHNNFDWIRVTNSYYFMLV